MADLIFVGQFIASKAGKTGLTVTVDVDRYTLADGTRTALVTGGSATEGRRGLYHYRLASADLATYQYVATFITADATVDQQEIAALGIVVPDALVGSRLAPATAGRTLDIAATGEASANVTKQAGVPVAAADANGNVPVVLYPTQGAVTFGQVKILADINYEGALHIDNNALNGVGLFAHGTLIGQHNHGNQAGQYNEGGTYGQYNYGEDAGQYNEGVTYGQNNYGEDTGQRNYGSTYGQSNYGEDTGQHNYGVTGSGQKNLGVTGQTNEGTNGQINQGTNAGQFNTSSSVGQWNFGPTPVVGAAQQEIADALKRAPAAGTPAVGSVYDLLGDVDANVDLLLAMDTSTTDATTAGAISRRRGNSWSIPLTIGAITGYTSLWFTIKSSHDDADTAAIVQIKKNASASLDGLLYVNGTTAADAAKGSITVSNATTGAIVIAVDETITDDLAPGEYYYDVQTLIAGDVATPDSGTFTVTADVTRSVE